MTIVSPVFVWMFGAEHLLEKYTLMDLIGLRTPGIFVKIDCCPWLDKVYFHHSSKEKPK